MNDTTNTATLRLRISLFLALSTLGLYFAVGRHDFINYDDPTFVTQNPMVRAGLSWSGLAWAFTESYADYWRPLCWLSHSLDCQLFGLNPTGHHLVSLGLHVLNTLLLFWGWQRMTTAPWRSAMVAALFAWHPLHVEAVAWVAERKEVLCATFWLLTILAYARYAERPTRSRYLLALGGFALGLMSKPMIVTLPCVLLLLDFWPLRRMQLSFGAKAVSSTAARTVSTAAPPPRPWRSLVREKIPFFALAGVISVMAFLGQRKMAAVASLNQMSLWDRVANALVAYLAYLSKTFVPVNLAVFYPRPEHWPAWRIALAAAVLLGISAWVVARARPRPAALVGWCWFLGTLVPVIGLIQVGDQAMADRYSYVPLIGLFVALVWTVSDLAQRWPQPKLVLGTLSAGIALGCFLLTPRQVGYWQNTKTLFTHAAVAAPGNPVACTVLGSLQAEHGNLSEAIRLYQLALTYRPDYSDAHVHWGQALEKMGQLDDAIVHYREAVRLKPNYEEAHVFLGSALASQRQPDEAQQHFRTAIALNPFAVAAHNNLAILLSSQGRFDEAVAHYTAALRCQPDLVEAHQNLALVCQIQGRLEDAAAHYQTALRLQPNSAATHLGLGDVMQVRGQLAEAATHYREGLRLAPEDPEANCKLAWLLATCADATVRNGAQAVPLAQKACDLTDRKQPKYLSALAAAQAEAGRLDEAVVTMQTAIDQASASGQVQMAAAFQQILEHFRAGRPFHTGGR